MMPYLRAKLEDRVTQCKLLGPSQGWMQVILWLHSALHLVWESSVLGNYLYYMNGHADSHSPLLHLAGVTLQYAAGEAQDSRYDSYSDYNDGNKEIWCCIVKLVILLDL
jgi:hypothetical protein